MKAIDMIWFLIIGLGVYGAFTNIQWLAFVVVPALIGLFIIITSKKLVNESNAFYEKMSKKIPFFFPSAWVEESPSKVQILIAVSGGVLFILFAVANWTRIY